MQCFVEHLGLAARDSTALKDWYVRVLGATLVFANGQTPPAFLIKLGDGIMIEIYPGAAALSETGNNLLAGWRHIALRVPSIQEARRALEERGVAFTESLKPAGGGGQVLFFRDLEDNLLHLVERQREF
jgi:glyoxylase I family protein